MRQMFYSQSLLEQQQRILRKKRVQFFAITAVWALLTITVFLLLSRNRLVACTLISGLISGAYFSWLLYLVTYDYKKEREYAYLIQEILSGSIKKVTGLVKTVETEETPLEKEYRIHFVQDELEKDVRMYRLSGRANVESQQWVGATLTLYVHQDQVAGFEVAV